MKNKPAEIKYKVDFAKPVAAKTEKEIVRHTKKSVVAEIRRVRDLLINPEHFVTKVMARNQWRVVCNPQSEQAVCWDIVGAEIKLNISRPTKVAIQNAAITLFGQTKSEVNDGFEFKTPDVEYKERNALIHKRVLQMLDYAIANCEYRQELPDPVRVIEKNTTPKEVIKTITVDSSLKVSEFIFETRIWYTEANFTPLICQYLGDDESGNQQIFVATTTLDKVAAIKDNELTIREVFEAIDYRSNDDGKPERYKKFWAVLLNKDTGLVYSAIELTKKQATPYLKEGN